MVKYLFKLSVIYVLVIFNISCSNSPRKLTPEEKNIFFQHVLFNGHSTAPSYINIDFKNNKTKKIGTTSMEVNQLYIFLKSIDSNVYRDGIYNDSLVFELTKGGVINVPDSIYVRTPMFHGIDLRLRALDLLLEEEGHKKIIQEYIDYRLEESRLNNNSFSDEQIELYNFYQVTLGKYFSQFNKFYQYYLFEYGIETHRDCLDGVKRVGYVFSEIKDDYEPYEN